MEPSRHRNSRHLFGQMLIWILGVVCHAGMTQAQISCDFAGTFCGWSPSPVKAWQVTSGPVSLTVKPPNGTQGMAVANSDVSGYAELVSEEIFLSFRTTLTFRTMQQIFATTMDPNIQLNLVPSDGSPEFGLYRKRDQFVWSNSTKITLEPRKYRFQLKFRFKIGVKQYWAGVTAIVLANEDQIITTTISTTTPTPATTTAIPMTTARLTTTAAPATTNTLVQTPTTTTPITTVMLTTTATPTTTITMIPTTTTATQITTAMLTTTASPTASITTIPTTTAATPKTTATPTTTPTPTTTTPPTTISMQSTISPPTTITTQTTATTSATTNSSISATTQIAFTTPATTYAPTTTTTPTTTTSAPSRQDRFVSCTFRVGMCAWQTAENSQGQWIVNSGPSAGMGLAYAPDASTDEHYLLARGPDQVLHRTTATLRSPLFRFSGPSALSFWYRIQSDVAQRLDSSTKLRVTGGSLSLQIAPNNIGACTVWERIQISLNGDGAIEFRFIAELESRDYIAVDEIVWTGDENGAPNILQHGSSDGNAAIPPEMNP